MLNLPAPLVKPTKYKDACFNTLNNLESNSMKKASNELKEINGSRDVLVGIDCSWRKRGFQSVQVVTACSPEINKVINTYAMCKSCAHCKGDAKQGGDPEEVVEETNPNENDNESNPDETDDEVDLDETDDQRSLLEASVLEPVPSTNRVVDEVTVPETMKKCDCNYTGASGGMERFGALKLFQRSEKEREGLRYLRFLGDGDSKAYSYVCAIIHTQ